MIASSEQLPLIEVGRVATRRTRPRSVRAPVGAVCGVMGFLCFLPYPALGVGNATAVQMGNVVVLAMCVPAAFMAWRGRPFWVFPLLLSPLCVATAKAALAGQDGLDVCFKALAVWGISCAAVLATQ